MKKELIRKGRTMKLRSYELEGKRWHELFNDEEDILVGLKQLNIEEAKNSNIINGIYYLESFKQVINNNECLTKKQLTQLKRNAINLYTALWNQENN